LGIRNLVRAARRCAATRVILWSGAKPEGERPIQFEWAAPRLEDREVARNTRRERLTNTALDRGGNSERHANRMRGVRLIAI